MPTGYTAHIEDGKITNGKDFLMLCARQFGACISLRDEPMSTPIPEEFPISTYHQDNIEKAKKRLEELRAFSVPQLERLIDDEYTARQKYCMEKIEKDKATFANYEAVLAGVRKWNPPTSEHEGLKKFAVEQIMMCIGDFTSPTYWEKELAKPKIDAEAWLTQQLKSAQYDLDYHTKEWDNEQHRTFGRNKWLSDLRNSLCYA